MATLQPLLLESNELLTALAQLSGSTLSNDHKLRRLTVELGIMRENLSVLLLQSLVDTERQSLSNLWAPLHAVVGERSGQFGDPVGILRAQSLEDTRGFTEVDSAELRAWATPFKFDGQELRRQPGLLRVMREALSLLPSSPLDDDFWTIANFDWLLRVKEDGAMERRARMWATDCFSAALADMERIQAVVPEAVLHVSSRFPTATDDPLGKIPLLVGATALVERAAAHGVLEFSELLREIPRGYHSPRESFGIAVELYTRDLCLMDALITYELKKGSSGAVRT